MTLSAPKYLSLLLTLAATTASLAATREPAALHNKLVTLRCDPQAGTCALSWPDGTHIGPFAAAVEIEGHQHLTTTDYPSHKIARGNSSGEITILHSGLPDSPNLIQHITLPASQPYILLDVEAASDHTISTRHISPLILAPGGSAKLSTGGTPHVIFTPWDNDMWVHYNEPANPDPKAQFDPAKDPDSYEITAIYDNASRHGLVLGSITHDLWRTGILARRLAPQSVGELEIYGGATGHWSHDVEPHGLVSGTHVKSPQILVGYFPDWRDGLETFGRENARIHPPLPWHDGVPFGWNSWAAYAQFIDRKKYDAVADFIHTDLEPKGFQNNHTTYINWDGGWSQLTDTEIIAAAKRIHAQGQKAGIYMVPFAYYYDDLSKVVEGTNGKYTWNDLILRDSHGQPLPKIDGPFHPLDPTHPGTLQHIDWQLARFVAWGYDSVKIDFLNSGALEGHHHDPAITTGVQAYSFGMQRIEDDLAPAKIGRPFFISLSIAPLFPAYGHSRRISCDAFGRIEDSDYLLNAATYSWWTNGTLYQFNDPDHTVIAKDKDPYHDQSLPNSVQTLEEARSRVNATVISGTLLIDSDDLMDPKAQARARELLTNPEVLAIARAGRAFRPVEAESGIHATPLFLRSEKDGSVYLAAFNYSEDQPATLEVDLTRLGLSPTKTYTAHDLWTNQSQPIHGKLTLHLTPAQSRLIHLYWK